MVEGKEQYWQRVSLEFIARHWKWLVVAAWLAFVANGLFQRWSDIGYFNLRDTDDNLRMMQVRALLDGQSWFDLRQYRLNPPAGFNVHWSHLVDLPLGGLILLLRPILGGADAERWAAALAPSIPLLVMMFALAVTVRRLIDPRAYLLAFLALIYADSTMGMFMPMRIDHHGWQLALLAVAIAAIADPDRRRGGLLLGVASAASLAIGLELLIYLALGGVVMTLLWISDRGQRDRLATYGVALGAGTGLAFLVFASNDNRQAVCDALSPVWMTNMMLGGALLLALAMLSPADWRLRLALALGAGLALAAFHALVWPHCLTRLEGVSEEVERLWLSHVREARPVYRHGWRIASQVVALPLTGLAGWALLAWTKRCKGDLLKRIAGSAVPGFAAAALLLWQSRTGPAAQMTGTIGAAALLWLLVPKSWNARSALVRTGGTLAIILIAAGAWVPMIVDRLPGAESNAYGKVIRRANYLCNSLWGLKPVARQPKGMVFTFIDLGPRLVTVTSHNSVAGPYHRNGEQIADVMNAFRGSPERAHEIIRKYRADYLLVCPNNSTTTIFRSESKAGFYDQLANDKVPHWLEPVDLGKDSPFRMWRVTG